MDLAMLLALYGDDFDLPYWLATADDDTTLAEIQAYYLNSNENDGE